MGISKIIYENDSSYAVGKAAPETHREYDQQALPQSHRKYSSGKRGGNYSSQCYTTENIPREIGRNDYNSQNID